jgi:DNA-binding response OmpR family regulator
MIAEALGEAGFEANLCPDAQEALRRLADEEYDVVVTDVNLPAMNGLRLFDLVREQRGGSEIPVVFVTGNARSAHTVAEIKRRGACLLTKPFSIRELLDVVRTALGR